MKIPAQIAVPTPVVEQILTYLMGQPMGQVRGLVDALERSVSDAARAQIATVPPQEETGTE